MSNVPKNPPLEPTTIRLDPDEIAAVDRLADQEQRHRSAMGRILIREALAARGEMPAAPKRTRKGTR